MLIKTNRVLLDLVTITNTTNNKSREFNSLGEMIAMFFLMALVVCFCWLNYEKSVQMLENDRRIASLEIKRRQGHITSRTEAETEIQQVKL